MLFQKFKQRTKFDKQEIKKMFNRPKKSFIKCKIVLPKFNKMKKKIP